MEKPDSIEEELAPQGASGVAGVLTRAPSVVLTGPSSSGKTSVGALLQSKLPYETLRFDADLVLALYRYADPPSEADTYRLGEAFNAAAAAMIKSGMPCIVEQVFWRERLLVDLARLLRPTMSALVVLECDRGALLEREAERLDRCGSVDATTDLVTLRCPSDIRVDTSACRPDEAATLIVQQVLQVGWRPEAFGLIAGSA